MHPGDRLQLVQAHHDLDGGRSNSILVQFCGTRVVYSLASDEFKSLVVSLEPSASFGSVSLRVGMLFETQGNNEFRDTCLCGQYDL